MQKSLLAGFCSGFPLTLPSLLQEWGFHSFVKRKQVLESFSVRSEPSASIKLVDLPIQFIVRLSQLWRHDVGIVKIRETCIRELRAGLLERILPRAPMSGRGKLSGYPGGAGNVLYTKPIE